VIVHLLSPQIAVLPENGYIVHVRFFFSALFLYPDGENIVRIQKPSDDKAVGGLVDRQDVLSIHEQPLSSATADNCKLLQVAAAAGREFHATEFRSSSASSVSAAEAPSRAVAA